MPGEHTFLCTVEWTLQFEIIFYALVHLFFSKNQRIRKVYPYFVIFALGFIICCKAEIIVINVEFLRYIIIGRDSLFWIFSGSGMYYLSLIIEKKVTKSITQKVLIILLAVFMMIVTMVLDPSIYTVTGFWDYLFLFTVIFILIEGFRLLKVSEHNILVVIGNNSYVIYLIHATFICAIFYVLNLKGINYGYFIHAATVIFAVALITGLSEILRSSVSGMRNVVKIFEKR